MKLPSNIERAAFPTTNKAYVGYGRGLVWRIRKSGTGGWEAFEINGNPQYERSATLALLSEKISRPDEISGRSETTEASLVAAHKAGEATGAAGVATFRAISLKHGLALYSKTGMLPNRAWTKGAMLAAAGSITGAAYGPRRRDSIARAIADLERWIEAHGVAHGD